MGREALRPAAHHAGEAAVPPQLRADAAGDGGDPPGAGGEAALAPRGGGGEGVEPDAGVRERQAEERTGGQRASWMVTAAFLPSSPTRCEAGQAGQEIWKLLLLA